MSTDEPVKPLDAEQIAEDLTLSNLEGTSWYGYALGSEPNTIRAEQYGDGGQIVATFIIHISVTKEVI